MTRWDEYIEFVEAHPEMTCKTVKQAVKRFKKMKREAKSLGIYFDADEVSLIINFAEEYLKVNAGGEWGPIQIQPWQAFIIAGIYGFKYLADNTRVTRTAVISTAKKNGKSTLNAVFALYDLFSRKGGRAYLAALDQPQTKSVYEPIELAVMSSPELAKDLEVTSRTKTILHPQNFSTITCLSKGAKTKQGFIASLAIFDEYYLYPTDELLSIIRYGFRSVTSPLAVIITTNGNNKQTPYYQEYERCKKILDGIIEDLSTFTIIYELDEGDRWDDPAKLPKANPMLACGVLDFDRDFKADLEEAKQKPHKQSDYKQFTCNLWVDPVIDAWIPDDVFRKCMKKSPAMEDLATAPSVLSFDLSKVSDFTVLSMYTWWAEKEKYVARHWFYIPEEQAVNKAEENILIKAWIDDGLITLTPGPTVDYAFIAGKIAELYQSQNILAVVYDRYQSKFVFEHLTQDIVSIDFDQSLKSMAVPTKEWEKAIYDGLIIDSNPIMRWMLSCAVIKPDVNGNYKPLKPQTNRTYKRIDAVITSIMAYSILSEKIKAMGSAYTYDDLMALL